MEINARSYSIIKVKNYMKHNNLFFIANGVNKNTKAWIPVEQDLKKLYCNYYKIFNRTTIKTLNNSIYTKTATLISGTTFFIKTFTNLINKNVFCNSFEPLSFSILAIKLNKKLYSYKQLKQTHTINYKKNKLLFYQFNNTNFKIYNKYQKKISK